MFDRCLGKPTSEAKEMIANLAELKFTCIPSKLFPNLKL